MGSSMARQLLIGAFSLLVTLAAKAESFDRIPYYGKKFYQMAENSQNDQIIKAEIHRVLSQWHISTKNSFDQIVESCGTSPCFRHRVLSYKEARKILFGEIHLKKFKNQYAVEDVYCDSLRTANEFRSHPPAPGRIPNPQVVNAEHTWPQSHFNRSFPKELQKSDLHSLYPVDSRVNSSRSNSPFGEVDSVTSQICPASKKGISTISGRRVFEPPETHKGNVARAIFYFAIRYNMDIDPEQEKYLRDWHDADPVDLQEKDRNQRVFDSQGNRNPFIDHPRLVEVIQDL